MRICGGPCSISPWDLRRWARRTETPAEVKAEVDQPSARVRIGARDQDHALRQSIGKLTLGPGWRRARDPFILAGDAYLAGMAKAFEFAIPTPGNAVPDGPGWIHEIKFDGFRMRVVREADRIKLFTRNGADFTDRYPLIVAAARRLKAQRFVLDGDAVVLDVRAYSDFDALVSRQYDDEVPSAFVALGAR